MTTNNEDDYRADDYIEVNLDDLLELAEKTRTHMTVLNNVALKISKLVDAEVAALRRTVDVYERNPEAAAAGIPDLIRSRIVAFENSVEELHEIGKIISEDFGEVFSIVDEGEEDEND